jgi:type II secretory pathway pseudopilin PulG
MPRNHLSHRSCRFGASLIETLVVIAIISILVSLLMPALHKAREAARRAACENNLHQLSIAMRQYMGAYKKKPDAAAANSAGGWSVAVLDFLEQQSLKYEIEKKPSLIASPLSSYLTMRPKVMACSAGYSGDSTIATIPAGSYLFLNSTSIEQWWIGDATDDFRGPWVNGPTMAYAAWHAKRGPHDGGFYFADWNGAVNYMSGNTP